MPLSEKQARFITEMIEQKIQNLEKEKLERISEIEQKFQRIASPSPEKVAQKEALIEKQKAMFQEASQQLSELSRMVEI